MMSAEEEAATPLCFLFSDVFMARLCVKMVSEHSRSVAHYIQPRPRDIVSIPVKISESAFLLRGKSQRATRQAQGHFCS